MNFSDDLLYWYSQNKRDLPWRNTRDPYKIWLSEIILQQTRVNQGLPYFVRFLNKFPTIYDLAEATEDKVLKTWQGLGYYSRARNLQNTAKFMCDNYERVLGAGRQPEDKNSANGAKKRPAPEEDEEEVL